MIGERMSLLDLLRREYVQGRVLDKYRLANGNLGVVVEDDRTHRRYHVEFKDYYQKPGIENLYGLLRYRFSGKTDQVERLIGKGDEVGLTMSYSQSPLREAYKIHSVSSAMEYRKPAAVYRLPYRAAGGY